jgi:hypothetical protein
MPNVPPHSSLIHYVYLYSVLATHLAPAKSLKALTHDDTHMSAKSSPRRLSPRRGSESRRPHVDLHQVASLVGHGRGVGLIRTRDLESMCFAVLPSDALPRTAAHMRWSAGAVHRVG